MQRVDLLRQIGEIEAMLKESTPDWEQRVAKWEEEWRARSKPQWTVFQPEVDKNTTGGERYLPQPDGSFLAGGYQPTKSTCNASWKTDVKGITGFRLEMLHDANLPANGPGRSFMGTFGLTEFSADAAAGGAKPAALKFVKATAGLETT